MWEEFLFRSPWIRRLLLVSFWGDVSWPILGEASWYGVVWRGYVGTENRFEGFGGRGRIEAVTCEATPAHIYLRTFWSITFTRILTTIYTFSMQSKCQIL